MSHWSYIAAAYGVVGSGVAALVAASWWTMVRAEKAADALTGRR